MRNMRDSNNELNRPAGQGGTGKKKRIIALCLIVVMVFMWIKVLGRKTPESAEAASGYKAATEGQLNTEPKISFIELPIVKGRNDVLTRDFFAVDGKGSGGSKEVNVVSRDSSEEYVRRIAAKLKLMVIVLGESPQVFINYKLLSTGDKLLVEGQADTYECEVVRIERNTVLLRCGGAEITLRLTPAIEAAD